MLLMVKKTPTRLFLGNQRKMIVNFSNRAFLSKNFLPTAFHEWLPQFEHGRIIQAGALPALRDNRKSKAFRIDPMVRGGYKRLS